MHRHERAIRRYIEEGRGQGHGRHYQPWLQIGRRGVPAKSNLNFRPLPMLGRHGHFLSRNEWHVALWVLWLGVADLREQFPLWPFPHPHPLCGHPDLTQVRLRRSPGLLAIAQQIGIPHGTHYGSRIPYVATTDLMITARVNGIWTNIAIAIKPKGIVDGTVEAPPRLKERLALEMAYCIDLDIRWHLLSDGALAVALRENLELCILAANPVLAPSLQADCEGLLDEYLRADAPVESALSIATATYRLDRVQILNAFHHAIWHRRLPVDIRDPIVLSKPTKLTDFAWANEAAAQLFGECHD